ncbi:MAG: hypothetical protein NVS3B18_16400 [Candidatus Dormibacteria bacterium]
MLERTAGLPLPPGGPAALPRVVTLIPSGDSVPAVPIDDHSAPLYSVGQVAGMLDVQAAFLRRLDTEEVVQPGRSSGGQRRYSRSEINAVQKVTDLIADGLTLAGVRRVLELEHEVARLTGELAKRRERKS